LTCIKTLAEVASRPADRAAVAEKCLGDATFEAKVRQLGDLNLWFISDARTRRGASRAAASL